MNDREPISIIVIDDHQMFAQSIARLLAVQEDFAVVAIEGTVAEGIARVASIQPDVAVVDYGLPDGSGVEATTKIHELSPATRVLMLTGADDQRAAMNAIEAGCAGFLTKDQAASELVTAIRGVHTGEAHVSPATLATLLPHLARNTRRVGVDLTNREREILQLLAMGMSTPAIADHLVVSINTVRNHVQNVLLKLNAHSKLEAVYIGTQQGIIQR
jgi:DNA-binding NarL/FixJ family response regulator